MKVFWVAICICTSTIQTIGQEKEHNLQFNTLPSHWDEALPLGNGMIGELIWQKDGKIRFSLDRADLWDERPMKDLHRNEFSYKWVQEQVAKKDYKPVQEYFDAPYDREPAPSKIPGAAMEIDMKSWGDQQSSELDIKSATSTITFKNGIILNSFVHATEPIGCFKIKNAPTDFSIELIPPAYQGKASAGGDVVGGDDLTRLGYKQGIVTKGENNITYTQEGWNGFTYKVSIAWKWEGKNIEGVWTISSSNPKFKLPLSEEKFIQKHLDKGYQSDHASHVNWWNDYWKACSIKIPDQQIEKQWYLEQYKFGSASRKGAPPISLQAIWTADNGRIPPWKGDYHHDLNTQLSYWPSYTSNHLDEAMAYLDHLDQNKENYKRYTKQYFGVEGLAVPGVTTLDGTEMGGWIQYSLSPTVSAWLSHHFYLQWRYSMDKKFLKERAYPWIRDVSVFLENITSIDEKGKRKLPISSSPEINDNSLSAWFNENTNYDLALMKFNFSAAASLAKELGLTNESKHWDSILHQFGEFSLSENNELKFASSLPYNVSHRHFSHMMAIHPLGIINWNNGSNDQQIITNTLKLLDKVGPDYWCGYSYAWEANMKAHAKDGEGALKALQIFSKAFCSTNSFHLNGDQTKSGLSKFQYRPFTLEGNFAFAAGLQEMLIQSHEDVIEVLPAIPDAWKDVSFDNLRTQGAFFVSAAKKKGVIRKITIKSEVGGTVRIKVPTNLLNPLHINKVSGIQVDPEYITATFAPGAEMTLVRQ